MRPVTRGSSPIAGDFDDYAKAKPDLLDRFGPYCCYCERQFNSGLAVEHMQPQKHHDKLIGSWNNYLLSCGPCNSAKPKAAVDLNEVLMPDRDNTLRAFKYLKNGMVVPNPELSDDRVQQLASATLRLVGFDRRGTRMFNKNKELIQGDRIDDRSKAYDRIAQFVIDLQDNDTPRQREKLIWQAETWGYFSLWMTHFTDLEMRKALIKLFKAADDCFDPATTEPIHRQENSDLQPPGGRT